MAKPDCALALRSENEDEQAAHVFDRLSFPVRGAPVVFAVSLLDGLGLDQAELGIEAYAEFGQGSQSI